MKTLESHDSYRPQQATFNWHVQATDTVLHRIQKFTSVFPAKRNNNYCFAPSSKC